MADELTREQARDWLRTLCPEIRNRRRPIEQEWLLAHAAWRAQRTRFYYLDGTSEHYIPALRRAVERAVVRGRQMLVPSPEFFEVYPTQEDDPTVGLEAEHARAYLGYLWHKRLHTRSYVDELQRSFYLYGRAIVKNTITVIDTPVVRSVQDAMAPGRMESVRQVWPSTRVVDPFVFYVWPETINRLDEAQVIVEDHMMPVEEYKAKAAQGVVGPAAGGVEIALEDLGRPEWPIYHTARLNLSGLPEPEATGATAPVDLTEKRQGAAFVALSEVWFKRAARWQQCWIVWNARQAPAIVKYQTSPYPEPPYRMAVARQMPGEHYTSSMASDLEPLQVWLNDAVNMHQDAIMLAMSPPALVNPMGIMRSDSLTRRPGSKWMVGNPATDVIFPNVPDTSRVGQANVAGVFSMIDSFSGSGGPLSEGVPARGAPRAGFAISTLIQLALADIKGVVEILEDEILTPTCSDLYRLAILFTPPSQRLALPPIMGLPKRDITISDLVGDWTFKWVGSLQSQDLMVRGQKYLTYMGMLVKLGPMLQQAGLSVDWKALIRRGWRDVLGERGAETIIRDMTPQEAMQMVAMLTAQGQGPVAAAMGAQNGGPPSGGGGGAPGPPPGSTTPAPATAEAAGRQVARGMSEGAVGTQLQGLRQG